MQFEHPGYKYLLHGSISGLELTVRDENNSVTDNYNLTMSIFGTKRNSHAGDNQRLDKQQRKVQNTRDMLWTEFNKFSFWVMINPVITIFAESKGALSNGKMFSFGNGGQSNNAG